MKLALFDFDGTISNKDSFLLFMRKADPVRFFFACVVLLPKIVLFLAKKYPNQQLKENFLTHLFATKSLSDVEEDAQRFCEKVLPSIIRPEALLAIQEHIDNGDKVVVVTASPRPFLSPWCERLGIDILGTELLVDEEQRITGELDGLNCMGEEKVRRIESIYFLNDYDAIAAYGDTSGDLPMLDLASEGERYYKPFR